LFFEFCFLVVLRSSIRTAIAEEDWETSFTDEGTKWNATLNDGGTKWNKGFTHLITALARLSRGGKKVLRPGNNNTSRR
jgi:hypothetical protein